MDFSENKIIADLRASLGAYSEFSQNDDVDDDDPISAYFRQRFKRSSKVLIKKNVEADRDSSIGLIDVDNVSLFDVGEENEISNLRFSEQNLDQVNRDSTNVKNKKESDVSKMIIPEIETELNKQRALAQRALKKLSNKTNELYSLTPEKRESAALSDISSKLMNLKLSKEKSLEKGWFQPNISPKTPRYFNDELSSFGGEDENVPAEMKTYTNEANNIKQSLYTKKVDSLFKELSQFSFNSDMKFEKQTEEEQIHRFEEDEKKFKLENSGLLHNSQISQFSGIAGEDIPEWESWTSKSKTENKNLSIGQFFNLRSNRVSSLVGSANVTVEPNVEHETEVLTSKNAAEPLPVSKNDSPLSVREKPHLEKSRVRRCASTNDINRTTEASKATRYSSDSCASSSTLFVQNAIAEMESGLSGTEIYEKLIKSCGLRLKEENRKVLEKREKCKMASENKETPKSSKVQNRKEMARYRKESILPEVLRPSRNRYDHDLPLCIDEAKRKGKPVRDLKLNKVTPSPTNDKTKKIGLSKGFYSSTPKNQDPKSENSKFRKNCGKVLMNNEEWEPAKVNSIKPIENSRSESGEENEKTILIDSTVCSEVDKKDTTTLQKTLTIEDTIVAGDLTVLSQRIEEMKRDSVCIVRTTESEEPVLLTVVQKLANLPLGSVDCSALMPLLRDQFPELLSNFPNPSEDSSLNIHPKPNSKEQDVLVAMPGSWIKLPGVWGSKEKIYACADVEKSIPIPLVNVSQKWILVSIESLELVHQQGKKVSGVRKDSDWCVKDLISVSLKEAIIPPDSRLSLKVSFKSKVTAKLELMLTFAVKDLMDGEIQTRNLRLLMNNVHPENYVNVFPSDSINFGIIADQCFDQAVVQVSFDGICEMPLTVYLEEDAALSGHFILKPCAGQSQEKGFDGNILHYRFHEGEKQVLEFRVVFRPNIFLQEDSKTQDFKASLVLMLGSSTDNDGILKKIPIKGSVGFAKFLCKASCSPLVFRASHKGQSITRSLHLKNVGSLSIAFSLTIMNEDLKVIDEEDVFVVPKTFYLSRNEEADIEVVFNARGDQNFTKRYLVLQVQPNGQIPCKIELIGIVTASEFKPLSRTSGISVSTKSIANSESVSTKLLTTAQSLSWPAVALEKEARQTFQIKSLSPVTTSIRITFEKNLDAFKLVNENGEKVQKLRKVLKPDSPCALTVIFRPDVVGAHNTFLTLDSGHSCRKKILLNGIGGITNLVMKNIKSDLNGYKMLKLHHSRTSNLFENVIEFENEGRIPAFLLISQGVRDFSLSYDLIVSPSSVVVHPDSKVTLKISQKLRNDDLQQLLSDRDIRKIATVCIVTGDEPSRLRLRKLVESGKLQPSERLDSFTAPFSHEKEMQLKNFKDPPAFENEFLKSLKVHEVAVVIERNAEISEPSILEDTAEDFFSFVSDQTVIPRGQSEGLTRTESRAGTQSSTLGNVTLFSAESLKSMPAQSSVTKWLETLDCF